MFLTIAEIFFWQCSWCVCAHAWIEVHGKQVVAHDKTPSTSTTKQHGAKPAQAVQGRVRSARGSRVTTTTTTRQTKTTSQPPDDDQGQRRAKTNKLNTSSTLAPTQTVKNNSKINC